MDADVDQFRKPTLLNTVTRYQGKTISLISETLEYEASSIVTRDIVTHPGAVVIVPRLSNGEFVLIKQYRRPVDSILLEFPAGTRETQEQPLVCAKRELEEETGFQASSWKSLGILHPTPGFCSEIQHCFFASDLTETSTNLDPDEVITRVTMTFDEVQNAIRDGRITDGKTIAVFTKALFHF